MNKRTLINTVKRLGMLVLAGVLLLVITLQTETLASQGPYDDVGRSFYRVAFHLRMIAAPLGAMVFPVENHHWSPALTVFTCFAAPFLWYGLFLGFRRVLAAWKQTNATAPADGTLLSRRSFLAQSAAGVSLAVPAGVTGYGTLFEPQHIHVREYTLCIAGLPEGLSGLRVLHLSDTHYGPFISRSYLEAVIEQANDLEPDIALLTGDYCHKTPRSVEPGIAILGGLKPRLGIVSVLGNHDHWEGAEMVTRAFSRTGIPVLTNTRQFLTLEGLCENPIPGQSLCLAGVDDLWEGVVSLRAALDGVPGDMPRIVLSHNPDVAEMVTPDTRVDLMVSGHTHGGQVAVPFLGSPIVPSRYGRKYAGGLCEGPCCPVLVSRGVGMALLPIRLGVPPEMGIITLAKA